MSERETQKTDDVDLAVDVDVDVEEPPESQQPSESSGGMIRSPYGRTLGRVLSTRGLVVALTLTLLFSFLFSLIPFVGLLGSILGISVAGFLYGLGGSNGRYLELLVAGAVAGGGSAVLGNLLVITFGSMAGLLGIGILGGALGAVVGHYFGRDFRDGLTRDVE